MKEVILIHHYLVATVLDITDLIGKTIYKHIEQHNRKLKSDAYFCCKSFELKFKLEMVLQ